MSTNPTENPTALVSGSYEQRLICNCVPLEDLDLSGDFVNAGENIAIVGPRFSGHTSLGRTIGAIAARQGKTVRIIDGLDAHPEAGMDAVRCDLLVVNELPWDKGAAPGFFVNSYVAAAGEALFNLLSARLQAGRSTVVVSSRMPLDWVRHNSFGLGTDRMITRLHMGIVVDRQEPRHQPLLDRVAVPSTCEADGTSELFFKHGLARMSWSRDPHMLTEYFGVTLEPRTWHWLHLTAPVVEFASRR